MTVKELKCTKCGARYEGDAKFCGLDRSPLVPAEPDVQAVSAKICAKCSRLYPSHASFCAVDGTRLEAKRGTLTSSFKPSPAATSGQQPAKPRTRTVPNPPPSPAKAPSPVPPAAPQGATGTVLSASGKGAEPGQPQAAGTAEAGRSSPSPQVPAPKPPQAVPSANADETVPPPGAVSGPIALEQGLVGKVIEGKYRIDSSFAEGGMAVLYLAHHITMERQVVVKVMHGSLLYRPEAIERFKRECKFVARLNHPNIVSVYDFGFIDEKQPYLVMEHLKGHSLADQLDDFGTLDVPTAAKIVSQICYGLEEAHETGIIHRDLKPENIILQDRSDRPDWVKIVDFGIAHLLDNSELKRLTRVGFITGTPEYMAPEQFSDRQLDTRCDIYALGAVLFELLVGHPPFESEDCGALMAKHLLEKPRPISDLRSDIAKGSKIEQIILKCLEKEPDKRFQKVSEVRLAVQDAVA